jgi:hypothetical protein
MATREGIIRITADRGAFRGSMRKMAADMTAQGQAMARNLSGPMKAGILNVGKSMKNTIGELTKGFKQVMTLGGSIAGGALIKDAIDQEVAYLRLADALSTYSGQAWEAAKVQQLVGRVADDTKIPLGDLQAQLMQLASASGKVDIEKLLARAASQARRLGMEGDFVGRVYTRLVAKGVAKSADEAENLTEQMNKLFRNMLGVDLDEAIDPSDVAELAGFANTTGNSFAQMLKLISLGGKEIAKDFGKANEIVEELGLSLKQTKGIDEMTKKLGLPKGAIDANKSSLENMLAIADMGPKKFAKMADALSGDVAGAALKQLMGGEEFMAAAKAGKVSGKEWDMKVQKLRRDFENLDDMMVDRKAIEAADARHKSTTAANLDAALNKVRNAFAQPKMIGAINKLAENLPVLADKLADLVDWIVNNPWEAAAVAGGVKVGGSFLAGATGSALKGLGGKLAGGAAGSAAAGAAGAGAAGAGGGALAGAAGVALPVLAAALAGGATGYGIHKTISGKYSEAYGSAVENAMAGRRGPSKNLNEAYMKKARVFWKSLDVSTRFANAENAIGMVGGLFGGSSPVQQAQQVQIALLKELKNLTVEIQKQREEMGGQKALSQMKSFRDSVYNASEALKKSFPNPGTSRGPIQAPPSRPGHEPVRG